MDHYPHTFNFPFCPSLSFLPPPLFITAHSSLPSSPVTFISLHPSSHFLPPLATSPRPSLSTLRYSLSLLNFLSFLISSECFLAPTPSLPSFTSLLFSSPLMVLLIPSHSHPFLQFLSYISCFPMFVFIVILASFSSLSQTPNLILIFTLILTL